MTDAGRLEWLIIAAAWLAASFGSAAAIAWLQSRVYPELSFHKLWALWTVIASCGVLVLFLFQII